MFMKKRVLDVGNCAMDHGAIRDFIEREFDAEVVQADGPCDAIEEIRHCKFDLVLVNRILDRDGSSGLEIIKQLKADDQTAALPVMLITNFEEHQNAAVEHGAVRGIGKARLTLPETRERLAAYLT
jgi:CheY-like chemotaxis protein